MVDFRGEFRIFTVGAGATVSIDGLKISEGGKYSINGGIDGGAILNPDSGTLKITNSTVSDNLADKGSGATLTMTNATVAGNDAPQDGSGIHNDGDADLKSNTITANDTSIGGALFNSGGLTLTNSIVAGNFADENIHGSFADGKFNLIDGDPMLGTFQDNGGPHQDLPPARRQPGHRWGLFRGH
jgi:hypothetical protein